MLVFHLEKLAFLVSSTLLVVMFINEAESLNHVLGTIALVAKIASGVQTGKREWF